MAPGNTTPGAIVGTLQRDGAAVLDSQLENSTYYLSGERGNPITPFKGAFFIGCDKYPIVHIEIGNSYD
jgi:hypothetical protein